MWPTGCCTLPLKTVECRIDQRLPFASKGRRARATRSPLTGRPVRRKLASGPKRKYPGERAFVLQSLAAELPWKSRTRYDELVSGRAVYTYVRNDPLNLNDHNGRWPTPVHEEVINKAFPGLSNGQRGVLKSASAWMDHKPNGQTQGNAYQHSMKAPGEDPAKAKQDARDFMNQKREDAQAAQGRTAENTSQISDRALGAAGEAIHTATDATSPAHVDASGNPRDWGGIPVVGSGSIHDAEAHNAEEANPTPAQFDNAVKAAQEQFKEVFGGGPVCVQATGSEAACR